MPLEYLVMLGLYAVGNIAYHLITFKECPEAAKELSIVPFCIFLSLIVVFRLASQRGKDVYEGTRIHL